ncbi:MFS general substrate transporter [Hyaloscypha variabilis F]|uniref:MFS general substrate transporter n=1 Tax=Hyaloscypha variabilis (strain UAMH 11265 / GT02V1 / F) TaxID=1149755 RepID=A0A2J6R4B2_HYAVF|nr:MFS general substrate transporter [Hyaloscypha variabilis F]
MATQVINSDNVTPGGAIDIDQDQKLSDAKVTSADEDDELNHEIDPKEERAFVWRLDLIFLTIGFLGYTFKYLDQSNISNAYVSGMKEDLKLYGNQLNYFTTYFNIGYMIMLYPSCIIISHIGPSVWLPTLEQVYGIRFLIGFCEGATWPGYYTIISQWYLPHEIALRMAIYNIAQPTGAMLSGAMQGALATNLQGSLGRAGWRWAFIVNGALTIFIALLVFFVIPGFPDRQNPLTKWYLKPRHIEIARARSRRVGRKPQRPIVPKSFLRAFSFWQLWAFAISWAIGGNTTPGNYYNLWLKSLKNPNGTLTYSVGLLNYLPLIGQAIQLVCELGFSGLSDFFGTRLPFLLAHSTINIASLIILIIRPKNRHTYMAGWYLNYVGGVSTMLITAWASENLEAEPEVLTVLFASGTILSYLQSGFVPIAAYPASQAPNWHIGAKLYLGFAAVALTMFIGIHFGLKWEAKKKAEKLAEEERESTASGTEAVDHVQGYFVDKV